MSSFEKTVKLACKPKAAPPKAKVKPTTSTPSLTPVQLSPSVHSTWTLSLLLRGPKMAQCTMSARPCPRDSASQIPSCVLLFALLARNVNPLAQVVFKALIVLHTMIRNGATDNVLQYLSSSDVLRLRNVSGGNWEGEFSMDSGYSCNRAQPDSRPLGWFSTWPSWALWRPLPYFGTLINSIRV
jgi:phosphatidylinositol-binding clathrin assembly protein